MSVEVGIPFATSENALTIYDCMEASRYTHTSITPITSVCIVMAFLEWLLPMIHKT